MQQIPVIIINKRGIKMRKLLSVIAAPLAVAMLLPATALAHVIVTPGSTETGEWVAFSIGVPNEKNVATTSIKLEIPGGLTNVQPNVEAGWKISTTKARDGAVSAIIWSGNIPAGQRADLRFTAQTPASPKNLDWKAIKLTLTAVSLAGTKTQSATPERQIVDLIPSPQ
jgi:uncharacterized protein YcnI